MAKFIITATTTVAELKDQFSKEVGGVLRVYEGRSEAAEDATLVSLGAKEGELECRTSRTVGKFEEAFQNDLNLKVKVYTKDNWVKVLDGITLAVAAELSNGMTKAKMEEYLSYERSDNNKNVEDMNNTLDWNAGDVAEVYKYMSIDELSDFLGTTGLKAQMNDELDYSYFRDVDMPEVLKITDGYCVCTLCSTDKCQAQWATAGEDGHGVCVKLDVNYSGWQKGNVFYTDMHSIDGSLTGVGVEDVLTIKFENPENGNLKEVVFFKKATGDDSLPFRIKDVILGENMTDEERQKCNAILSAKGISVEEEKPEETVKVPEVTENKDGMSSDEQLTLLDEELDKILDYKLSDRIKKMFFDIVPDRTIIYSTDGDYEEQKVASAIDCVVADYDANCNRCVKAVKFKVEDGGLYAIECLNDDEDEIWDCYWNLDNFPENYRALSQILNEYRYGNHSAQDDVTLIPQSDAEEEEF